MARRRRPPRREVVPDPKYANENLTRFINKLMLDGKKTIAYKIVYAALDKIETDTRQIGIDVFKQAITNASPDVEVRSRRVGGATYQVPREVRPSRRLALAIRWIINAARERSGKPMFERLAQEILEASKAQGTAVKKKEDLHRMAEANRAFVHFRW
jgi:small subunit ribosomal protein S7